MFFFTKSETDIGDKSRLVFRAFKDTVAVGISTLFHRINAFFSLNVHRFHSCYQIFHFNAISSDVLYRARSDLTGDERQVLRSIPSMFYAICNEVIPYYSRSHSYRHRVFIFLRHFDSFNAGMEYQSVVIFGKQQVTAATNMQKRCHNGTLHNQLLQFFNRRIF